MDTGQYSAMANTTNSPVFVNNGDCFDKASTSFLKCCPRHGIAMKPIWILVLQGIVFTCLFDVIPFCIWGNSKKKTFALSRWSLCVVGIQVGFSLVCGALIIDSVAATDKSGWEHYSAVVMLMSNSAPGSFIGSASGALLAQFFTLVTSKRKDSGEDAHDRTLDNANTLGPGTNHSDGRNNGADVGADADHIDPTFSDSEPEISANDRDKSANRNNALAQLGVFIGIAVVGSGYLVGGILTHWAAGTWIFMPGVILIQVLINVLPQLILRRAMRYWYNDQFDENPRARVWFHMLEKMIWSASMNVHLALAITMAFQLFSGAGWVETMVQGLVLDWEGRSSAEYFNCIRNSSLTSIVDTIGVVLI